MLTNTVLHSSITVCSGNVASFPVLPRTRFTFTCDNCGGEHFETGKAWSETSREVDVILYIIIVQVDRRQVGVAPVLLYIVLRLPHVTFQTRPSPFQNVHRRNYRT